MVRLAGFRASNAPKRADSQPPKIDDAGYRSPRNNAERRDQRQGPSQREAAILEAVASGYGRNLGHVTRAHPEGITRLLSSPAREDGETALEQSFTKGNAFSFNFVRETWPPTFPAYVKAADCPVHGCLVRP